mgnify:CR=1 FL=1
MLINTWLIGGPNELTLTPKVHHHHGVNQSPKWPAQKDGSILQVEQAPRHSNERRQLDLSQSIQFHRRHFETTL